MQICLFVGYIEEDAVKSFLVMELNNLLAVTKNVWVIVFSFRPYLGKSFSCLVLFVFGAKLWELVVTFCWNDFKQVNVREARNFS